MTTTKKIIVTGGAGFIGSNLVEALLAAGHTVIPVDNFAAGRLAGREFAAAPVTELDIRDTAALAELAQGAAAIVHLAALPRVQDSIDHPRDTFDVNVTGTLSVLEAARAAAVPRVVFASSAAVYGDSQELPLSEEARVVPQSPYGLHKYVGEGLCRQYAELYGLRTVSFRFFNVYGPRADANGAYALLVGRFLALHAAGKPLTITGDGTHTRDYVHVRDIVRGLMLGIASERVGQGEVINLGSGRETSVNELASLIGGPVEHVAPRVEPARSCAAIARAEALLGWRTEVVLADGIAELMEA